MTKICDKSKSQNLLKFKSENLSKFKKFQSTNAIKKFYFLTPNAKITFIKLK